MEDRLSPLASERASVPMWDYYFSYLIRAAVVDLARLG